MLASRSVIGREDQLRSLVNLLEQASLGRGAMCLIWGAQGLGKRHLLTVGRHLLGSRLRWVHIRLVAGQAARQCERINKCLDSVTMPTVLVIEDAQFASKSIIALISGLVDDLKARPVLAALCVHENLTTPSAHAAFIDVVEHGASCIQLDRLPTPVMRQLLRSHIDAGQSLRADVFERAIALANGNPQYLKDLTMGVRQVPPRFDLRTLSLQVERMLERVAPMTLDLARAASILGDSFEMRPLAFIVDKTLVATERVLQRLCDIGMLRFNEAALGHDSYSFIEPGARWVLRNQLSPARREDFCRRALSFESTDDRPWALCQLADYHEGANLNAKAYELLLMAGDEALAEANIASAISHFDRATVRASTTEQEVVARWRLARALDRYGQDGFAVGEYERAIQLAAGALPEATVVELCCELRQSQLDSLGDSARSLDSFAPPVKLTSGSESIVRARLRPLFQALRSDGEHQQERATAEHTSPVWERRSHSFGSRAAMLAGKLSVAADELRTAKSLADASNKPEALLNTLNIAAENAGSLGQFAERVTFAREAFGCAAFASTAWARLHTGSNLAAALVDAGKIKEASDVLRQVESEQYGSMIARVMYRGISVLVSCLSESTVPQIDDRVDLLELALGYGERSVISYIGAALALASLQNGDIETAQEELHRCVVRLPDSTDASLILILVAQVGSSEMIDLAAARLGSGPLSSTPFNRAVSHLFSAIRARRSRGKVDKVRLATATQTFERFGCGYLHAVASLVLGHEKGAFGLFVGKSAQVVGMYGAAADPVGTEPHLTPRQRLVARLLHNGYSNRRIGDELGIAEGTVAIHVAAILRKSGVKSRMELVTSSEKGA
jgi:DNA-binding CsgD family transcriptional regulator/tetratricopeptide (TPR) repeat protein